MIGYKEAQDIIFSLYEESSINDIQYIDYITDASVKYESGVDDFTLYIEGIYSGLNSSINNLEKYVKKAAEKSKEKSEYRQLRAHSQGKETLEDKLMRGNAKLNKGFKKVGIVATNIYGKFKKDMLTEKEKIKMSNKIAAGTKLAALAVTEPVPLGPIQVALNACCIKVALNPKDDVDKELNKIILKAKDKYKEFKAFVANKALKERDPVEYNKRAELFEISTGQIAKRYDMRTKYLADKEKRAVNESVNDDLKSIDPKVEYISKYVFDENYHVTEDGEKILIHLIERGYDDIVESIYIMESVDFD